MFVGIDSLNNFVIILKVTKVFKNVLMKMYCALVNIRLAEAVLTSTHGVCFGS